MSRGISKFQTEIMNEIGKCGTEGAEMRTVLMVLSHRNGRSRAGFVFGSTQARRAVKRSFMASFYRAVSGLAKRKKLYKTVERKNNQIRGMTVLYLTERGKALLERNRLTEILATGP